MPSPPPDDPLHRALRGDPAPRTEVLRGERPPLVDAGLVRALTSALMLGLMLAATLFRTRTSTLPFDPVLLVLHAVTLAFAVRAALALGRWAATFSADAAATKSALVLGEEAMLIVLDGREWQLPRTDVLDVLTTAEGRPEARVQARSRVQLVRLPPHPPFVLPPWFAGSAEVLTARIRRWLGPGAPKGEVPGPDADPERIYADATRGQLPRGAVAVPEGSGYLARAPYAALLGVVIVGDALLHAGALRTQLLVPASAACVLAGALFVGWLVWMRRRRAVRLGLGLVLTREELLARGPAGVVAVPWGQLAEVAVTVRSAWSPVLGALDVRTLSLATHDGQSLVFDGGFLGYPVELVAALCEAYRAGRVP